MGDLLITLFFNIFYWSLIGVFFNILLWDGLLDIEDLLTGGLILIWGLGLFINEFFNYEFFKLTGLFDIFLIGYLELI